MVERTVDIPPKSLKLFDELVAGIPGAIVIHEGFNYHDLAQRVKAVISTLDSGKIRLVDLYVSPTPATQQSVYDDDKRLAAEIKTLRPEPPSDWLAFYRSLPRQERSRIGVVLKPLMRRRYGSFTLSQLQNEPIGLPLAIKPVQGLAFEAFGITLFKTDPEQNPF